MTRRDFLKNAALLGMLPGFAPMLTFCRKDYYSVFDFVETPKTDVHFHYNTFDDTILKFADSIGMHIVSVNVNASESIDMQLDIATHLQKQHPGKIEFLGTFAVDDFGKDGFVEQVIARIDHCMNLGARGIKIWKNIGMALQDENGNYVMADHPAFAPIFAYLEKQEIPLIAHLGEPLNCWLPIDEMTEKSNQAYYRKHPQYHMYLHPEMPSYEKQIIARDQLLVKYPKLSFVGAHIGSLEWSIDEVAKRFDAHPRFTIDISARIQYLYLQAIQNRTKMQSFLTKYQDRILYGTDITHSETEPADIEAMRKRLHDKWLQNWHFFATEETIPTTQFVDESLPKQMNGLRLPRVIVDKIFSGNAKRIFG